VTEELFSPRGFKESIIAEVEDDLFIFLNYNTITVGK